MPKNGNNAKERYSVEESEIGISCLSMCIGVVYTAEARHFVLNSN